ncbi:MAG: hypothetical protein RBR87_02600 [Bacteroidales bacterium]|jgi:hypothetical protein|nr:hypothetical protein [Bacteroidales bacterium]
MRKIQIILALMIGLFTNVNVQAQDDISPERKQAIDSLALEKVRDLSKYVSIIGSKNTAWSEANRVIDRAEELFMQGAEMGVSTLAKPEVDYYKVRQYFERLMRLNYDRVEIEWFKIEYVSDLQRQPDGTYVGVITIFQKFKGYDKEGGLVYEDTTKKDITVYVKRKETQIGGRIIGFWDVLLGDMRVKETSK